ncbi:hypothetical protein LNN38_09595, partial [Pseudomonas sp. LA21]|uniref:hypothetical protein n=1 Tax=Pseudomonas sp. LA21 TaxID=2893373 RepID=UPI001FB80F9B
LVKERLAEAFVSTEARILQQRLISSSLNLKFLFNSSRYAVEPGDHRSEGAHITAIENAVNTLQ